MSSAQRRALVAARAAAPAAAASAPPRRRVGAARRGRLGRRIGRAAANGCRAGLVFIGGIRAARPRWDDEQVRAGSAGLRQYGSTPAMTCHACRGRRHHRCRVDRHALPPRRGRVRRRSRRRRRARRAPPASRQIVLPAVDVGNFERGARAGAPASAAPTRWASIRCAPAPPARPTWRRCATRSRAHARRPAPGGGRRDRPRPLRRRASTASARQRFYAAQLALAARVELPVILHVRRSADTRAQAAAPRAACRAASRTPSTAASSRPAPSSSSASSSASAAR